MKNKKGFTLVELLVVITIIGIIMVLAVPNIMKMSERMNDRGYKSKKTLIEQAAVNYASTNANKLREKLGNDYLQEFSTKGKKYVFSIPLKKLIDEGYYKAESSTNECKVSDPRNKSNCLDCVLITITLDDENRSATASLSNETVSTTSCDNEIINPI